MNNTLENRMQHYQTLSDSEIEQLYVELNIVNNLRTQNLIDIIDKKDADKMKAYLQNNNNTMPEYGIKHLSKATTWYDYKKEDLNFILALEPLKNWEQIFVSPELVYLHQVLFSDGASIDALSSSNTKVLKHLIKSQEYFDHYTKSSFIQMIEHELIDFSCPKFMANVAFGRNEHVLNWFLNNPLENIEHLLTDEVFLNIYQEKILVYQPSTLEKLYTLYPDLEKLSFDILVNKKLHNVANDLYNPHNDYQTYYAMYYYNFLYLMQSPEHNFSYILEHHRIEEKHVYTLLIVAQQDYEKFEEYVMLLCEHIKYIQPELMDNFEKIVDSLEIENKTLKQTLDKFCLDFHLNMHLKDNKDSKKRNKI